MSATDMLFGMRVVQSRMMPATSPHEYGHRDWRERLNRNLSRPSTGRWEPLTYVRHEPVVFMVGRDVYAHPDAIVALKFAARSVSPGERDE